MRKTELSIVLVAVILSLSAGHLVAADLPRFLFEGRLGSIQIPAGGFLDITRGNHISLGVLFSYRPAIAEKSILNRLTVRTSWDGARLGGQDAAAGLKDVEQLHLVNFAIGLDALRTSRLYVTLHGGGAVSRDHFVVQEFTPVRLGSRQFVNLCNVTPEDCQSIWNVLGNGGVEERWIPSRSWSRFFIGADYTRFAGSKNQIVFTTGISF